jgi:hypothetical protein
MLEYLTVGSALLQCCALQVIDDEAVEMQGVFYVFVLINMLINNYYRGTRIHLYPMVIAFFCYSVALIFGILITITYYNYALMTVISCALLQVFGNPEYYAKFVPSGKFAVGCVDTLTKMGNNKVLIYYPTEKAATARYADYRWAMDGDVIMKGLSKFSADIVPMNPFYYIMSLK